MSEEIDFESEAWLQLSFGEALRKIRYNEEMTTTELSKKANISQPYISQLENDVRLPSEKIIRKLSIALAKGKDVFDGFYDSENPYRDKYLDEFVVEKRTDQFFTLLSNIKKENGKSTLENKKIAYSYNSSKGIIDFDKFKLPSDLIDFIVNKNNIPIENVPELFSEDESILDDKNLYKLVENYSDKDVKLLSIHLSENVLEQLLIHYRLCKLFAIKSDISKLSSDEQFHYLSALRQEYYYDKATEKTINIDTRENFFDGETIVVNGKTLNEDDKTLLLNIINRLAD